MFMLKKSNMKKKNFLSQILREKRKKNNFVTFQGVSLSWADLVHFYVVWKCVSYIDTDCIMGSEVILCKLDPSDGIGLQPHFLDHSLFKQLLLLWTCYKLGLYLHDESKTAFFSHLTDWLRIHKCTQTRKVNNMASTGLAAGSIIGWSILLTSSPY